MGFAANGYCFDTVDGAAAYACGHDYPLASSAIDGTGHVAAVVIECTGSVGNVLTLQRDFNGGIDGVSSLALTSPACDVMEWHTYYPFSWSASDGAVLGGAIIFAWSVGWGWKAVYSVLRGRFSSSEGDGE